jgi:soluble P-type ATPase
MLRIDIPGYRPLELSCLILDYNGTLARDGALMEGVPERIRELASHLRICVLTADTFGDVRTQLSDLPCELLVIAQEDQAQAKADFVEALGYDHCVCIGNGRNDQLMLKRAALGVAVMQEEGGAVEALLAADVVASRITDALDLLLHPLRLTATLRM